AVCVECRPPGAATPPTEVLRLMWWLAHDRWDAVDAVTDPRALRALGAQARGLATAHLPWRVGRKICALHRVDARSGTGGGCEGGRKARGGEVGACAGDGASESGWRWKTPHGGEATAVENNSRVVGTG